MSRDTVGYHNLGRGGMLRVSSGQRSRWPISQAAPLTDQASGVDGESPCWALPAVSICLGAT